MRQTQPTQHFAEPERASTGSVGLDDILGGGFDPDRVYLIEGRVRGPERRRWRCNSC